MNIDHLQGWTGRTRISTDILTPRVAASLAACLNLETDFAHGDSAPPCAHWCMSPEIAPMSRLGADGHPERGDFLPPVPLPRRMWAGGDLRFSGDFRIGDTVTRRSRIGEVSGKTGRSGTLVFVSVFHDYETPRGIALNERHDIVYRDLAPTAPPVPVADPQVPDLRREVMADPVLLMRYSAATFNGHRIHYDRDYCITDEGYPGLVVHGPLQATLLLALAQERLGRQPQSFSFRGMAPLFDGARFSLNLAAREDGLDLWTADASGRRTMQAIAA